MSMLSRRSFLTTCGAGAASVLGLAGFAGKARAGNRITWGYPRNGFSQGELGVIHGAMGVLARHYTSDAVLGSTYAVAKRSLVDNRYSQDIGLPIRGDWSWACMRYQIAYYLRRSMPRIYVEPYYSRDNYWARAPIGVVQTQNITQGTGSIAGQFHVYLNRYWLTQRAGMDSVVWAGVLAHELMHNLGHIHGKDEYASHLQINAIQQAIVNIARPPVYSSGDSGVEEDLPPAMCGCS